jgi:CxxC-x17-CxxC domain-containing protein
MSFLDKTLTCRECKDLFIWTVGEQQFYKTRALINIPARCPKCRTERKVKLGLPSSAMTEVVCAQCSQATTVPFVPRNGNPVYCSTCLSAVRATVEVAAVTNLAPVASLEVAQSL